MSANRDGTLFNSLSILCVPEVAARGPSAAGTRAYKVHPVTSVRSALGRSLHVRFQITSSFMIMGFLPLQGMRVHTVRATHLQNAPSNSKKPTDCSDLLQRDEL